MAAMAATAMKAPFKVGAKELYLYIVNATTQYHQLTDPLIRPNFSLALLRTDYLPPNQAKFVVPLWFSKLDLRDYLYHAYAIRTHSIISYVKQQRAKLGKINTQKSHMVRRWHRPRAKKYMTVQMEEPFVWPEEPEDLGAWGKDDMKQEEEYTRVKQKMRAPDGDTVINEERREKMKEQAKALLEGRERWKPAPVNAGVGRMLSR